MGEIVRILFSWSFRFRKIQRLLSGFFWEIFHFLQILSSFFFMLFSKFPLFFSLFLCSSLLFLNIILQLLFFLLINFWSISLFYLFNIMLYPFSFYLLSILRFCFFLFLNFLIKCTSVKRLHWVCSRLVHSSLSLSHFLFLLSAFHKFLFMLSELVFIYWLMEITNLSQFFLPFL